MSEDSEIQDPLALNSPDKNYGVQTPQHQEIRCAPGSLRCFTPEIRVIKEEEDEEGWAVRDLEENQNPDGQNKESSAEAFIMLMQRNSRRPKLIMEVTGKEEEQLEGQQRGTMGNMKSVTSFNHDVTEKSQKGEEKVQEISEVATSNTATRRGRRHVSKTPLHPGEDLKGNDRASRRSQRKKIIFGLAGEKESNSSQTVTEKKPSSRKMIRIPIEIPMELLKQPKEKVEYRCSVCGREFPHAYKLERHELIHTGEKPYLCSICGRGFNQKGNLKTHYKVHLGHKGAVDLEEENPNAPHFFEYLKSLPGESNIRTSCCGLDCGKACESQSAAHAHLITAQGGSADPSAEQSTAQAAFCHRCSSQFDNRGKLEEHMKTHIKEKPYSCLECGKRFINERYIPIHQRIHTGERPYLCSLCGRSFHTASSLKLHMAQHSGERPFACSICGKTFRIKSYLSAHYQTHIKARPFICSVCGKGYSRAEELKVHYRLHSGERPYKCGECGKSFIYRQGLRQHQRTHAGRRIGPTRQLGRPKQQLKLDG